jgi:hypothetical protein
VELPSNGRRRVRYDHDPCHAVIAAAIVADDDIDDPAAAEIRDVIGVGESGDQQRQRGGEVQRRLICL